MPMKGGLFVMCFICFLNRYKCRRSLPFVWSIWEGGGHIYSKRSKVLLASFVLHFITCEVPPLCKQTDIINSGFFRSYRSTMECLGFESGLLMTCLLFNGGSSFQDWRISRICICAIQVCWRGTEGNRAPRWFPTNPSYHLQCLLLYIPLQDSLPDTIVEISHMICGKSQVLPFQAATWLNLCGRSPSS